MARTAPVSGGGDYPVPESGWHVFRLSHFIDLGTQTIEWNGDKKHQRKILYGLTLVNTNESGQIETDEESKPFVVWERFTFSMSEKANLRKFLEEWRGKRFTDEEAGVFDLVTPIEKNAAGYVNIVHNEKNGRTYANIGGVGKLPKGAEAAPLLSKPVVFDLDNPDWNAYEEFSDNLKSTISKSPEFQAAINKDFGKKQQDDPNFDINDDEPF